MSLVLSARLASPEARSGLFYLTMFASGGAAVTYLPIWLSLQGITEAQIGVINALPILVMMVLNLVVGRIADRAKDWRSVIIIGCMATAVASVGLLFVSGFWAILLFWTLTVLPMAATGPVVDAAVMRLTRRRGSDFGVIRAWGTVGFMTFNALAGVFAAWWGPVFFIPLFVGLSVLRAVASLYLPLFRAPEPSASDPKPLINPLIAQRLREVMKPWFLLPLFGMAMVFGIHMMINAFAALVWMQAGISAAIIGPLVALAAFAEAAIMFLFKRISRRFTARHLLLIAAIATTIRMTGMALEPFVPFLIILQLMHGLSFAVGYLGAINFIANWTSEKMAAEAQGLFTTMVQACSIVATIGFGALFGLIGQQAFYVAAVFAVVGGVFIWLSIILKSPQT